MAVLYAFSGPRASKKEKVFQETKRLIRKQHSEQPLVFLENIVSKKPHPEHWLPEEAARHPTTRLLHSFAEFNEGCITKVRPAIEAGRTVVVLRYGLDVYLDSIARTDCAGAKREAFELHHAHLVPARVIRGTPKPQYLIPIIRPWAESDNVYALRARKEMREIEAYFDNTGQNPPIYLRGESVEECAALAVQHILNMSRSVSQENIRA